MPLEQKMNWLEEELTRIRNFFELMVEKRVNNKTINLN